MWPCNGERKKILNWINKMKKIQINWAGGCFSNNLKALIATVILCIAYPLVNRWRAVLRGWPEQMWRVYSQCCWGSRSVFPTPWGCQPVWGWAAEAFSQACRDTAPVLQKLETSPAPGHQCPAPHQTLEQFPSLLHHHQLTKSKKDRLIQRVIKTLHYLCKSSFWDLPSALWRFSLTCSWAAQTIWRTSSSTASWMLGDSRVTMSLCRTLSSSTLKAYRENTIHLSRTEWLTRKTNT